MDTLGAINEVAAIPLALVGFAVTLIQLARTKKVAAAARDAAADAAAIMKKNHLLVLLPQLHRAESDLDRAVEQGNRELVAYHLSQWRWQAGQLRGFVDGGGPGARKLARAIQSSITLAASAKIDVLDKESDLNSTARPVQDAIASVTGQAGQMSVQAN